MRTRIYTFVLILAVWMVSGSEVLGQQKGSQGFEHVHALAMNAEGRSLFLGAHTGLFRSEDGGKSWTKVTMSAKHSHLDIMAVAHDPRDPKMIYVGTHEAGIFKTTNSGATWGQANSGLGGLDVHGLALDPNVPSKLHAAVREKGDGIYRTTDGGGKWVRVDDGPGGEVKVLTSANISTGMGGIFLYAGTAEGLQRSPDCFWGWTKVGGLPANRTVNGFAVDPGNPKIMYVAMRDGLFRSADAETWKRTGGELKNLAAVAINPKKPNEVYVATMDGKTYMSADAGMKWKKQQ